MLLLQRAPYLLTQSPYSNSIGAMFPIVPFGKRHQQLKTVFSRRTVFSPDIEADVREIIEAVRVRKDEALIAFTERFDGVRLTSLEVPVEAMEKAYQQLTDWQKEVFQKAETQIRRFHEKQQQLSWFSEEAAGAILGQRVVPFERVGLYVPGGKAVYPSSVFMNAIPAQVAGVEEIIITSPPGENGLPHPSILAAVYQLGIRKVFAVGGAQAIAALALGTESIPAVDKIVGPGNAYVAAAKRMIFGQVAIDAIAGPSEIAVLADHTANPEWVAIDMISQLEHEERASGVLVTPHAPLAEQTREAILRMLPEQPRKAYVEKALSRFSGAIVTSTMQEAVDAINELAPEHLELHLQNPWHWLSSIRHAGAIFIGSYSPVPIGDYMAGPNHVLPTAGTARYASALGVEDFVRRQSLIALTPESLLHLTPYALELATMEGLPAHAQALQMRLRRTSGTE